MTRPQHPSLAAAARRGLSWSGLSVTGGALIQVGQVAVAARFLSREDFGVVALASVALALGSGAADLGTASAVLHRQRSGRAELSSLLWLNAATGLLLAAGVGAAALLVGARWLLWVAPPLLAAGLCQVHVALLRRELRFRALACMELVGAAAGLLCVVLLAPRGLGAVALLGAQGAAAGVRALLALGFGLRLLRPQLRLSYREVEPFVRFGAYQLGQRLVNVGSWHLDRLVLAAALGVEALGVYHLAYQLVIRPFSMLASLSQQVALPLLARLQADAEALRGAYLTVVRLVATAALPLYVGAFVLAGPLVELVYGSGWADVAALFCVLWPLGVFYAVGNPVGALIVATGKVRLGFWWNVFAAAVHLVAVLVGVAWGAVGVATALVLATALLLFPGGFYLRWLLVRMRPRPFLASLARPLLSASAMGVAVHLLAGSLAALPAALQIALAVASGALLYGAAVLPSERGLLAAVRSS
jgi:lipopolysaccharide exporter